MMLSQGDICKHTSIGKFRTFRSATAPTNSAFPANANKQCLSFPAASLLSALPKGSPWLRTLIMSSFLCALYNSGLIAYKNAIGFNSVSMKRNPKNKRSVSFGAVACFLKNVFNIRTKGTSMCRTSQYHLTYKLHQKAWTCQ